MRLRRTVGGFTLLELLVALSLFSIMSLLAWRGLDTVLQSREAVEAPGRTALELAAAWTQLEMDLHAARATGELTAGPANANAPYILASAQRLSLLRGSAACTGCWEGVAYDLALRDGNTVLRRRTTALHTDAAAALSALTLLAQQTDGTLEHILLRGAGNMRIAAWRVSAEGLGAWVPLGATAENVFPAAAQRQGRIKSALKVEWQLAVPWEGWVSKVVLLENRW